MATKTPRRQTKLLPIYLPGDVYARLEELALAEERDPLQHARWLIKRAMYGESLVPLEAPSRGGAILNDGL